MRHWYFWSISAPFAFVLASQVGFLTHLVPLISDRPAVDPGVAVAINAIMALAGRLALGFVIDWLDPRRASALCFLIQVAAIVALARGRAAAGRLWRLRDLRLLSRQQHHPVAADHPA